MQLLIDQQRLAKALQIVGRIVPRRPVTPIVSAVVIEAEDGWVYLRATDLQSTAQFRLEASVHAPGSVAVLARTLSSVVSTLTDGEVVLSQSGSGESLRLTSGAAAFRLQTLDASDVFPPSVPQGDEDAVIETGHLIDLISRTTFCAVDSEEHSPFAGVYVSASDGALTMAATDSYQLAHYRLPAAIRAGRPQGAPPLEAVLPTAPLNAFAKALQSFGGDETAVTWTARTVHFTSGSVAWSVRRLDVQYPNLSRFTGPLAGVRVEVDRDRLIEGVKQVSSIADDASRRSLCLTVDTDRLHLFTTEQELGEAQIVIALAGDHPRRRVWLDARRLLSALRAQPSPQVALYLSEPLAPVAVAPADESVQFRAILMPLRLPAAESEAV